MLNSPSNGGGTIEREENVRSVSRWFSIDIICKDKKRMRKKRKITDLREKKGRAQGRTNPPGIIRAINTKSGRKCDELWNEFSASVFHLPPFISRKKKKRVFFFFSSQREIRSGLRGRRKRTRMSEYTRETYKSCLIHHQRAKKKNRKYGSSASSHRRRLCTRKEGEREGERATSCKKVHYSCRVLVYTRAVSGQWYFFSVKKIASEKKKFKTCKISCKTRVRTRRSSISHSLLSLAMTCTPSIFFSFS